MRQRLSQKEQVAQMLRLHSYYCDVMKRLSNMAEHEMSSFTVYFKEAKRQYQDLEDHMILV